jgi:hypothetical protein
MVRVLFQEIDGMESDEDEEYMHDEDDDDDEDEDCLLYTSPSPRD